jgi:regulation of enolase protein 1 (concanavalin A-like superfamily)
MALPKTFASVLVSGFLLMPLLLGAQFFAAAGSSGAGHPPDAPAAGRADHNDEFDGSFLDPKWSWFNPPASFDVGNTTPGWIHIVSQNDTNFGPSATNGTVLYQNMSGNISLETKLSATPANGVEKTGLILYNSDSNWMALKYQVDGGGPYVEVGVQTPTGFGNLLWTAVTADPIWLRLVKDGLTLTTYYSSDGVNWTEQFNYTQEFTDPYMAGLLVSDGYALTDFAVDFDYFRFSYPNRVPEILSPLLPVTFNEDEKFGIGVSDHFYDPDGDNLTFKAAAPHIKGGFDLAAGDLVIYGPPNWFGSENVLITATDPMGRTVQAALNVTVRPVEDPPVLTRNLPDVMVFQNGTNSSLDLSKYFQDNDTLFGGDRLVYGAYDYGTVKVNITPAGRATLAAPVDFWGVLDMVFTATDNAGLVASGPCTVTVAHVNQAPRVVRPDIPDLMVNEDDSVTMDFSPVFWDPDGDPMTLVPSGNARIAVSASEGTLNLTFRPGPDYSNFTESIAITAQDIRGLGTNWVLVDVTVTPVNDAPRISKFAPPGELVIKENRSQMYNITVNDPENGKAVNCTWYLDGELVDRGVFEYYYQPGYSSAGMHNILVTVSDGELTVKRSWNVTVENENREPYNLRIFSPRPGDVFELGSNVTLEGTAADLDGDELVYTWMEGSRELGEGKNITVVLPAGNHVVYLQVTDGFVDVESHTLSFSVKGNSAPKLFALDPVSGQRFNKGANIHFRADADDTDGDLLFFCWTEKGQELSISPEFYKDDLPVGTHRIYLTISDGKTTIDTYLTVEITEPSSAGSGPGFALVLAGALAAVVIAAAAAVLVLRRRKRPVG